MDNKSKDKIKKIFLETFKEIKEKDFDFNKDRSEFENWDSLNHMQILSEIESAFEVNFEMDEVININKIEDIINLIDKKKND